MTFFVVSLIVFALCLAGVFIFLGLWTYKDAQVKSTQPPALWVLVVLLVPNLLGLIIYLLVGRSKKDVPAPRKYKRSAIVFACLFGLSIGLLIGASVRLALTAGLGGMAAGGTSSFLSAENFRSGRWTYSARRADGIRSRSPVLTAEELASFHVTAASEEGGVYLRLEQGARIERMDISGEFDSFVSLHDLGFEPGRIRISVDFAQARRVRVEIAWRH